MSGPDKKRSPGKWIFLAAASALILVTISVVDFESRVRRISEIINEEGIEGVYYKVKDKIPWASPNVYWKTASPASQGMDGEILDALKSSLAERGTEAFLVVRNNRIVAEFYGDSFGPNRLHYLAALTKSAVAAPLLLVALTDGNIELDDYVWSFIPDWRNDQKKKRITIRHLVSHSSGIENVSFRRQHTGWKQEYLTNPIRRFRLALDRAPVLGEPGDRYSYSGVGFYVLAYVLASRFAESSGESDVRRILEERIMSPMGIPGRDWTISYGETYFVDGINRYALGSGASFTARALARIGQLFVDGGQWEGKQLVSPVWVDTMLVYAGLPAKRSPESVDPAMGLTFMLNCDGDWPSLPRDAAVGAGGGHQLLVVVPSLDLVVVRFGESLVGDEDSQGIFEPLERLIFRPLRESLSPAGFVPDSTYCGQ